MTQSQLIKILLVLYFGAVAKRMVLSSVAGVWLDNYTFAYKYRQQKSMAPQMVTTAIQTATVQKMTSGFFVYSVLRMNEWTRPQSVLLYQIFTIERLKNLRENKRNFKRTLVFIYFFDQMVVFVNVDLYLIKKIHVGINQTLNYQDAKMALCFLKQFKHKNAYSAFFFCFFTTEPTRALAAFATFGILIDKKRKQMYGILYIKTTNKLDYIQKKFHLN